MSYVQHRKERSVAEGSSGRVKVAFDIEGAGASPEIETLWATKVADGYRIENIPFYARSVAWGDVVSAVLDAGGMLRYLELVEPSGHSTIRLWFARAGDVQKVRDDLRRMNCSSELEFERLVAVDVPPSVPYSKIRAYLEDGERTGTFEFEEGCLSQDGAS